MLQRKANIFVSCIIIRSVTMPSSVFVIYGWSLALTLIAIHEFASNRMLYLTDGPLHRFSPRNWVSLKSWKNKHPDDQLEPKKVGLYQFLLITHFSVKLIQLFLRTSRTALLLVKIHSVGFQKSQGDVLLFWTQIYPSSWNTHANP